MDQLEDRTLLATFTVNSATDPGDGVCDPAECTLREAITAANTTPNVVSPDEIHFAISGPGVHTIRVASTLPTITDPVVIDGYTQPDAKVNTLEQGSDAVLRIEISGELHTYGLAINASNTTVRGLVINQFGSGIIIQSGSGNVIEGSYIGTTADGMTAPSQNRTGISVSGDNNLIGGTSPAARNVISSNVNGIEIQPGTTGNKILGNYVGTDPSGTVAVPNGAGSTGGAISIGGSDNMVGDGTDAGRNIISGNAVRGLALALGGQHNTVLGNYIGTDVTGERALGNLQWGVGVSGINNTVGGTTAGARNVISGNPRGGVLIVGGEAAFGNRILGNYIGVDRTGLAALGNGSGIEIDAVNNVVGGIEPGAGNVISGHVAWGVYITTYSGGGTGNQVMGNLIGTDATGTRSFGKSNAGVKIDGGSNNTIGGTSAGARNIISGIAGSAVDIRGDRNHVLGNYIGPDVSGARALENSVMGVNIHGANNTIGGTTPEARNVISGNVWYGVYVAGASATGNQIFGNYIGTNASGTETIPKFRSDGLPTGAGNGVGVVIESANNTIGGAVAGAGNLISGNHGDGIAIRGSGATGNLVQGNLIGTDASGTTGLENGQSGFGAGVSIESASNNLIGGGSRERPQCDLGQ